MAGEDSDHPSMPDLESSSGESEKAWNASKGNPQEQSSSSDSEESGDDSMFWQQVMDHMRHCRAWEREQDACIGNMGIKKPLHVDGAMTGKVHAIGTQAMLMRPCVDCGLRTGSYCDNCEAVHRLPGEEWARGQKTPLCTSCDRTHHGICHFCRRQPWCVPPPSG